MDLVIGEFLYLYGITKRCFGIQMGFDILSPSSGDDDGIKSQPMEILSPVSKSLRRGEGTGRKVKRN